MKLDYASTSPTESHADDDLRLGWCSLVNGLLIVAPFVTGIMAVLFGIAAIRTPRRATDRGFGLAGIALGLFNLGIWTIVMIHA